MCTHMYGIILIEKIGFDIFKKGCHIRDETKIHQYIILRMSKKLKKCIKLATNLKEHPVMTKKRCQHYKNK